MKFYSEELKQLFNTPEELEQAELVHNEKIAHKKQIKDNVLNHINKAVQEFDLALSELQKVKGSLSPAEESKLLDEIMECIMDVGMTVSFSKLK